MNKIFLVSPVRNVDNLELTLIKTYVLTQESAGKEVYWPYRDTKQDDPIGNIICTANRKAIMAADEVHVWWNNESRGILFDLGMAWAFNKKVRLANDVSATDGKSFNNLLRWLNKCGLA